MRFRNFVIQNFPFLEDDFDALTDYQLFCKMVAYVKKLYINNEKLLKEITANLEQMYEDGKFDSLIEEIVNLQTTFTFDTVSDMKSATNLVNGCYTQTLGYHDINDGGGARYYVRTITEDDTVDEMYLIALSDNTLVAEILIDNKSLNVKQLGAYGDGEHDDTDYLKALCKNENIINGYIPSGTYNLNGQMNITHNNMNLIGDTNIPNIVLGDNLQGDYTSYIATQNHSNISIKNLKIDGGDQDTSRYFISVDTGNNVLLDNIEIYNGYGYGTRLNHLNNLTVKNMNFHDIRDASVVTGGVYGMNNTNYIIENIRGNNLGDHLVYVTGDNGGYTKNVTIRNIRATNCGLDHLTNGAAITVYGYTDNVLIDNCFIKDCYTGINIAPHHLSSTINPSNVTITNSFIESSTTTGIIILGTDENKVKNVIINNNTINGAGDDCITMRYVDTYYITNNIISNATRYGIQNRLNSINGNIINNCLSDSLQLLVVEYLSGGIIANNYSYISSSYATNHSGLTVQSTSVNLTIANNRFTDCNTYNYLVRGSTNKVLWQPTNDMASTNVNRSIMYGNAIPTVGDYTQGDIIFNIGASSGNAIGWVCTSSGTPGTWKSIGTVAN